MLRSVLAASLLVAAIAPAAPAQARDSIPAGWRWLHDAAPIAVAKDPADSADARDARWRFTRMPPGYHVTTGPGSLLYDPGERAAGRYTLTSQLYLFPRPTESGYGLFFGGRALGSDSARWNAVLLRRDGAVAIVERAGADERALTPWITHAAIRPHAGRGVVENVVRLQVEHDSVRAFVNDSAVVAVPRAAVAADGHFGFRVGRAIDLHVSTLDHTRHLAPPRGVP